MKLEKKYIWLYLPNFQLDYANEITEVLNRMNVKSMFGSRADLSKISPQEAFISELKHYCVLKVCLPNRVQYRVLSSRSNYLKSNESLRNSLTVYCAINMMKDIVISY